MSERWADIPGYEGRYQVSDLGRVRSVDHHVRCGPGGKGSRLVKGRILRSAPRKSGHHMVVLGKGNSCDIHPLVLRAFVGPPPPKHEALHGNHVPSDNRLKNLRWGTRSENLKMDYEAGNRVFHNSPNFTRWK